MIGLTVGIRREGPADEAGVREVEEQAFGRPVEARLVDMLRAACPERLSLVAVDAGGRVVGHVLFTPVTLEADAPATVTRSIADAAPAGGHALAHGMGLGPLAVLPEVQRQGIGSALLERGLAELRAGGCPFIVVVGHPEFYPRFGFVLASGLGLRSQWDAVPDEAWMVVVLHPAATPAAGVVRFRSEFDVAG